MEAGGKDIKTVTGVRNKEMDHVKAIYEDPSQPGSLAGVNALYAETKKRGLTISKQQIRKWLRERQSYTLHKPAQKRFKRNRTTVFYKDELWQMDLCDMRALKEYNDGVTFLLTVIDVFSKNAFAKPLLDKKGSTVLNAFQMILEESDRKPSNVQTDHGSEFVNRSALKNMALSITSLSAKTRQQLWNVLTER